jgi:glycine oxidase
MPQTSIDTLIIGQGLAGSLLAWTLIQRGQRVVVWDDRHHGCASRVAAGLINPLAGMRFTRPAEVDVWLASGQRLYRTLERTLNRRLLFELPMVRLLRSPQQRRFYDRQAANPANADLLGEAFAAGGSGLMLGDAHGGFHQRRTGYIATVPLLEGLADWLTARQALRRGPVAADDIRLSPDGVRCQDISAPRVVFCEGWQLKDNPWFNWLPLEPAKGEILTLASDPAQPSCILNGGHWLVPLFNGGCKVGTTVDHHHLDSRPTATARTTLLAAYQALLPLAPPGQVVDQQAGVRPNTRDRKPLLGAHPQHPELLVFNGFGGRGSLTIPWHAERFADWLAGLGPLPAAADIQRVINAG